MLFPILNLGLIFLVAYLKLWDISQEKDFLAMFLFGPGVFISSLLVAYETFNETHWTMQTHVGVTHPRLYWRSTSAGRCLSPWGRK